MPYLIVPTEAKAKEISEVLYDLRRPSPDPDDVTKQWVGWIVHSDGRAALRTNGAGSARIDPNAIPDTFIELVKTSMTAQEIADAKQVIEDAKGSVVTLAQITPQRVKDRIKSDAEMEADGWFPEGL